MPDNCHLCGTNGAGVIFACISCGSAFCSVHHNKRSHGCKGRVAAPPITPSIGAGEERRILATGEIGAKRDEKKGELVNKLNAGTNGNSSPAVRTLLAIPDPDARVAAVASVLLRSAEKVRKEGGFTRTIEETYIAITRLAEAGKPGEAWGAGAGLVGELESEPTVGAAVREFISEVQPKLGEVNEALRSASKAVEDGELYGAVTYEARVFLGKAARNFREGRFDEAVSLAKHSKLTAKKSMYDLALRIVTRLEKAHAVAPGTGLENLAREDAKAAIREAARFAGKAAPEVDRELVVASIAVAWDVVKRAKAKGVETAEYEATIRQARSALDLADASRALRLAGQVRDAVETRLARMVRGATRTT